MIILSSLGEDWTIAFMVSLMPTIPSLSGTPVRSKTNRSEFCSRGRVLGDGPRYRRQWVPYSPEFEAYDVLAYR